MKKILVATDGSDNSKAALLKAKDFLEAFDYELDIIYVTQPVTMRTRMIPQYAVNTNKDLHEEGQAVLDESMEIFKDFKERVNTKLRSGDSASEIIKQIEEEDYDLVIMGSSGHGAFSRIMLGSVSQKVLNNVGTTVLIVK